VNTARIDEVDPQWFEGFFEGDDWLLVAGARDPERTTLEVEFVASRLPDAARVLDVPCGTGRHAVALAERGFHVAGLDISDAVLDVARKAGPTLDLRQGDMRELPWPDESFDAVINLWTAFGYFESQGEDERALAEFARVLAPGGTLILDTINQTAYVRGLQRQMFEELDGVLYLQEHEYDIVTGRSRARWTFVRDGRRSELSFDFRVYTAPEYAAMMGRAGFRPEAFYGGFDGVELGRDTWRQIIVARRE
jgi:ubiquinone/menaquinone biosynthesis C-methylase UbiE